MAEPAAEPAREDPNALSPITEGTNEDAEDPNTSLDTMLAHTDQDLQAVLTSVHDDFISPVTTLAAPNGSQLTEVEKRKTS